MSSFSKRVFFSRKEAVLTRQHNTTSYCTTFHSAVFFRFLVKDLTMQLFSSHNQNGENYLRTEQPPPSPMPSSLCLCPRKPPPSPLFSTPTPIREVLCKERTKHAREIVFWCMKSCYECTLLPYFHSFTAQDTSTLKRGRRRHETKHGNTHPSTHPSTHSPYQQQCSAILHGSYCMHI